jgi:hypothetical protein
MDTIRPMIEAFADAVLGELDRQFAQRPPLDPAGLRAYLHQDFRTDLVGTTAREISGIFDLAYDPPEDEWLLVREAAAALGVTEGRVRALIKEHRLTGVKHSRTHRVYVEPESVTAFKNGPRTPGPKKPKH